MRRGDENKSLPSMSSGSYRLWCVREEQLRRVFYVYRNNKENRFLFWLFFLFFYFFFCCERSSHLLCQLCRSTHGLFCCIYCGYTRMHQEVYPCEGHLQNSYESVRSNAYKILVYLFLRFVAFFLSLWDIHRYITQMVFGFACVCFDTLLRLNILVAAWVIA